MNIFPYKELCVKVNNSGELFKLMDMLKTSNKPPRNDIDSVFEFLPNYIYIRIGDTYTHLSYLTDEDINSEESIELLQTILLYDDVDPNIYNFKDFNRIKNIINTGYNFLDPTYEPKKRPKRLLESKIYSIKLENSYYLNDKYQYRYVPFEFKSVEELKRFENYIKRFKNILAVDDFNFYINISINTFLEYQDFNDTIHFNFYNSSGKLDFTWGRMSTFNDYFRKDEYEKIFNIYDLLNELLENIIIYGSSIIKPSYEPKERPKRLLESFDIWYPYRFKTEKEFKNEFGENWRYHNHESCSFTERMDELLGKPYPFNIDNLDNLPKIYLYQYVCTIENWMLTKNDPISPTYNPKKRPKRLLENLNKNILKKGKYKVISVIIKNNNENIIFNDLILNIKNNVNVPDLETPICYVLFTNHTGSFRGDIIYTAGPDTSFMNYEFYNQRGINLGLSKEDISPVFNITEFQQYIKDINKPTYEPKKRPKRLLENNIGSSIILSPEQQRNIFKIGQILKVREDALIYFTDVCDDMKRYLGKKVKIIEISALKDKYNDFGNKFDSYISEPYKYDANPHDLLITVKNTEDISDSATWYWYYRCFEYTPSYEPKKRIDRTL